MWPPSRSGTVVPPGIRCFTSSLPTRIFISPTATSTWPSSSRAITVPGVETFVTCTRSPTARVVPPAALAARSRAHPTLPEPGCSIPPAPPAPGRWLSVRPVSRPWRARLACATPPGIVPRFSHTASGYLPGGNRARAVWCGALAGIRCSNRSRRFSCSCFWISSSSSLRSISVRCWCSPATSAAASASAGSQQGPRLLHDARFQAQPRGDVECARLSRQADQQAICGFQRGFIELHRGVQGLRGFRGIGFQARMVGSHHGHGAALAEVFENRHGQRRAFVGFGAGANFVQQHQIVRTHHFAPWPRCSSRGRRRC